MSQDNDSLPVRDDGHNCFVCGPHNAIGLRVKFQLDGDVCRGEFTPGRDHCGYDGITHGGILFSLLDDVMANWLYLKGLRCFTAKCEIRYRNPLPVGCRVLLAGKSLKRKRNVVVMEGLASRADTAE
ncbi:MAG: PaaI family thioesterase, partial [Pirellulaceae bacterium]